MKLFKQRDYGITSLQDFKLFTDCGVYAFADAKSTNVKGILRLADEALQRDIPQLYASGYRRFFQDGNRTEYEAVYFNRRDQLKYLLLGELVSRDGKYTDKIIDLVWLILEETTWIIPAHNHYVKKAGAENDCIGNEYTGDAEYIDLFSAETGALIAFTHYWLKDEFDKVAPIINQRILYELRRRIIHPYIDNRSFYWMALDGKNIASNWTSWITSNVLTVVAVSEPDLVLRKQAFDKALECLDAFVDSYAPDGGCSEGPLYWERGVGSFFTALEIVYDMTEGAAAFFEHPLVRNMMDYIRKVHLNGNAYANFADSAPFLYEYGLRSVVRMGIRTGNPNLTAFAMAHSPECFMPKQRHTDMYREVKDLVFKEPEGRPAYVPSSFDLLENLQVCVHRSDGGFICAAKGGHNGELHNHNDIGNIIMMYGADHIFIDIGAPTYTKYTFGATRYDYFAINSDWHNLPEINGYRQKKGDMFVCDKFIAEENRTVIEYQSAYEKEAGVQKCVREILFSKDEILINERICFDGEHAVFRYYMVENPVKIDENTYAFRNGVRLNLPFAGKITAIPLEDELVMKRWGRDSLYRVEITIPAGDNKFTVKLWKELDGNDCH